MFSGNAGSVSYANGPMVGTAKTESASDLVRIRERIEGNTRTVQNLAGTLAEVADRTYGGVPTDNKAMGMTPSVGNISSLDSALSAHEASLGYLSAQIQRFATL